MAISPSRVSRATRCCVQIYAVLALAPLIILLTVSGSAAADKQLISQSMPGTVKDALGRPLSGAVVILRAADGRTVARTASGEGGQFKLPATAPGTYDLIVRKPRFKPAIELLVLPARSRAPLDLVLESKQALTVEVSATRVSAQYGLSATGAAKYTFTGRDITNLPQGEATPLNQVLLQMPGVALDQNQEIHIRGEHAGIQYQMNGILLPLDLNNDPTFTQLLNSYFVKSVSLIDGVLPAEYGYRTAGVVEISTKNGCDDAHNEFTIYGGQRDTAQPSFQLGGCSGKFSYYLTGVYTHSNLGLSSATSGPDPIHDSTDQGQGFAYLTYAVSATTQLSLIAGMTVANNQFPNVPGETPEFSLSGVNPVHFPSADIDSTLDQQDYYGVLALNGALGTSADYQVAYTLHYNRENFNPDTISDLIYQGIAPKVFDSDFSNAAQSNLTYRWNDHTFRTGFYFGEYGVEADNTSQVFPLKGDVPLTVPISTTADLNKINLVYGVYLQDTWQLSEKLSVNFGSRWDRVSGLVNDSQFSPTINFVYKPRRDTTIHAGFARNFQVPNFQGISTGITALKDTTGGVGPGISLSTNLDAETDYTWDVGYIHQFTPHLVLSQDSYFRIDRHYIDEGQFGFVPIDAPFNYVRGYGAGLENSVTYNLPNFSLRLSQFVAREEVRGVATGQYNFPPPAQLQYIDRHYIVLDHTPLVGASGGAAYKWKTWLFTFDGLFSSGLRGGFANRTQLPKVWQFNLSAAKTLDVPVLGHIENRVILLNVFDRINLIRPATGIGVFQAAYGPRVTVYDALTVRLPSL
ncbi:TonB-dependent receptor [Candidatus Binatus sp.]|uniref:TonB-dependent receptor n=1 Tax=Candidatus Binatus sp. TaxID=2811406 RepID=UPI003CC5BD2F